MKKIGGIIPAMATPMNRDGSVDTGAVRALADALIANGADGLFAVGSMGEAASLGKEERIRMIGAAAEAAAGRVPVIGGSGFVTTRETVEMTQACADLGVAAVSVISPYYWKLSQEDLYAHYARVIHSTDLPVFVYNLPNNTGLNVDPETVGRLFRNEGLAGAKDSSANWENTKGYMDATGEGFTMLVGEDTLCLRGLEYGSCGSISAPANVYTYVMKTILTRFRAGDTAGAQEAQEDWNRIIRLLLRVGSFPANFKLAADLMTAPVGAPRLPVQPADPAAFAAVKEELDQIASRYGRS